METVSKPPGLPVFPPHDDPDGDCVLARILDVQGWRSDLAWPAGFAGGIAHRLDTSTSGALVVADDPAELARIREAFSEGRLRKTYRFLAAREVPWDAHACELPIAHDRRRKGRMVVQRGRATPHRGRWYPARTRFLRLRGPLFEARMRSGVMHQIRVHAAFLGIPLLGDRAYGGGPTPPDAPPGVTFFLHHVGIEGALTTSPVPLPRWADV